MKLRRVPVPYSRITEFLKHGTEALFPAEEIPDDLELRFVRDSIDQDGVLEFVFESSTFEDHAPGSPPPGWSPAFKKVR